MKIRYSREAIKFLERQPKKSVERIRKAVVNLTLHPPMGDIKSMQGYSDGRKRLRVDSWRIIFRNDTENQVEILLIIDIGNRGDIYK